MAELATTLFFVVAALLVASAVLAKQPERPPARIATLLLAIGTYVIYEYASQKAYENFNIRADLLILLLLLFWAVASNATAPKRRLVDGPDFRRDGPSVPKKPNTGQTGSSDDA